MSGIAEMLMQSEAHAIHVLPALPSVWRKGSVQGFAAKGGYRVSFAWQDGKASVLLQAPDGKKGAKINVTVFGKSVEAVAGEEFSVVK